MSARVERARRQVLVASALSGDDWASSRKLETRTGLSQRECVAQAVALERAGRAQRKDMIVRGPRGGTYWCALWRLA